MQPDAQVLEAEQRVVARQAAHQENHDWFSRALVDMHYSYQSHLDQLHLRGESMLRTIDPCRQDTEAKEYVTA